MGVTEDTSERDARAILKLATSLIAGSALIGLIVRFGSGSPPDVGAIIGIGLLIACVATLLLMRANQVRLATRLFLFIAWSMVAAISLTRGGLYAGTVGLYLLCTVLAGVLLSARAAIITCAANVAAALVLLLVEARGWVPPVRNVTFMDRAATSVLTLVVTTTVFLIALRRLQRANERLLESQVELEKTVAERTQSLVVARDQALGAARAKMSFLANMSHELRTPMHAVVGITELLRLKPLDPDTHELVETIGKSGDALVAILDDVLDLAKIEAGRLVVEQAPYAPRALVDELVALLGAQSKAKNVRLSARFEDDVPSLVLGDRTRVRQVLMNLAGNALKFTSAGSVEIVVKEGSEEHLSFEVIDTGIGISPEELARLFQPFVQGDLSTTRRFGGTGLGLAISKQLAELMGGKVHARSEPGRGSTFFFNVKAPPQIAPASESVAVAAPKAAKTPLKILLAEDSELNRKLALAMLDRLGYQADVATNGVEALGALAKASYDAVLLDVHMPEMDGLEVMRQVRAWSKPRPWLIAITASALPDDQQACFAAGANDFLAKPVKLDSLEHALLRLISSKTR